MLVSLYNAESREEPGKVEVAVWLDDDDAVVAMEGETFCDELGGVVACKGGADDDNVEVFLRSFEGSIRG